MQISNKGRECLITLEHEGDKAATKYRIPAFIKVQRPAVFQVINYVIIGDTTSWVFNGATRFDLINRSSLS